MKKANNLYNFLNKKEYKYILYDPQGHILAKTDNLILKLIDAEIKCPTCNKIYNLSSSDVDIELNTKLQNNKGVDF